MVQLRSPLDSIWLTGHAVGTDRVGGLFVREHFDATASYSYVAVVVAVGFSPKLLYYTSECNSSVSERLSSPSSGDTLTHVFQL